MSKKLIIISGASKGLGQQIAIYCEKKYEVHTFARSEFRDENKYSNIHHHAGIDVRDYSSLESLSNLLTKADAVVNNVGIAYDGILATQSIESITEVINVNLVSVLNLTKLYLRNRLKERKGGSIINISSIIGIRGYSGLAAYSASKAGLDGMTRSLAREMGPKGFRVNSILPGYMETDLSRALTEAQKNQIIRRTPLGRLAQFDDICPLVEFLISEKSKFMTGQSIVIDGGITV